MSLSQQIREMWSRARYDFGISTAEFWELTPKHFFLLHQRHQDDLLHREMCAAFTTAAVLNSGFCRPEESVVPLDFMPNHPERLRAAVAKPHTPQQQAAMDDYMAKVMQLSAELKERAVSGTTGPMLTQMSKEPHA